MMDALLLAAAVSANYGAFACLALAMPEHWSRAGGQAGNLVLRRRRLRSTGFLMLGAAYVLCICRDGASFGSLLWGVSVSAAALAVALTLTWWPGLLLPKAGRSPSRDRDDDPG